MYLSREKWQLAWVSTAASESKIAAEEETKLGTWIWRSYGKKLVEAFFPSSKALKPQAAAGVDGPGGKQPEYPMKIALTDLAAKMQEAQAWGFRILVLGSGCSEVGTFFQYKFPADMTIQGSSLFLMKKDEKKAVLKRGMEYQGLCAPLLLSLDSSTPDIVNKVCCDEFPADVFSSSWTPQAAFDQGFISDGMRGKLECEPDKWRAFEIITHSNLAVDEAKEKLSDKIPHFDKMAIIVIDPESIAK